MNERIIVPSPRHNFIHTSLRVGLFPGSNAYACHLNSLIRFLDRLSPTREVHGLMVGSGTRVYAGAEGGSSRKLEGYGLEFGGLVVLEGFLHAQWYRQEPLWCRGPWLCVGH